MRQMQLVGSKLQVEFAISFFCGFGFCLLVVGKVQLVGSELQVELAIGALSTCPCLTSQSFSIFMSLRFCLAVGKLQLVGGELQMEFAIGAFSICPFLTRHSSCNSLC